MKAVVKTGVNFVKHRLRFEIRLNANICRWIDNLFIFIGVAILVEGQTSGCLMKCVIPKRSVGGGAHLPFLGREPLSGNTTIVCDAWPVRRQSYGYLPTLYAGTKLYCLMTEAHVCVCVCVCVCE